MEKRKELIYAYYGEPDFMKGEPFGYLTKAGYFTREQMEALDAQEKAAKLIGHLHIHTWGGTPEGKEFEAAYKAIKDKYSDSSEFFQMNVMYEYGRIQGIKAERQSRSRKKALKIGNGNTPDKLLEMEEELLLELEAL